MRGEPLEMETREGKVDSAEQVQKAAGKGVFRVDVDTVEQLYENYIIPLTKEVEVCRFIFPNLTHITFCRWTTSFKG